MLDSNRILRQKLSVIGRIVMLLVPMVLLVLILSQVVFAKNTYIINDGSSVKVHTSFATDPAQVLQEAGVHLDEDDTYTTQEGIGISEITIQRQQVIGVVRGGQSITLTTYGTTVEKLLEQGNILLGKYDVVSAQMDEKTYDGMIIEIRKRVNAEETYTVSTPYQTLYALDPALAANQTQIMIPGVEGQILKVDSVTYLDGQEVHRHSLSETVLTEAVTQIVAVGSLEGIPEESIILPDNGTGTEAPEAITGNGQLYIGEGLIITPDGQILTYKDSLKVKATAYHNTDPGCTIYTALGTLCRVGAIAVDPKVIPYNTRMYIVTDDGKYIYGIAVAEDCGGAIKGNRIDLYFNTTDECWTFGVRKATVYFLG